jgi:hypothetical protein
MLEGREGVHFTVLAGTGCKDLSLFTSSAVSKVLCNLARKKSLVRADRSPRSRKERFERPSVFGRRNSG